MKKIMPAILVAALLTNTAHAESKLLDYLRDYGLPCAVSLGAGLLLADKAQTGVAIGGGVCLGVGTATFIQSRKQHQLNEDDLARIQNMVDASSEKAAEAKQKELEIHLQEIEKAQKSQLEDLKTVLREVLAERMLKMEAEMRTSINKKLESGELMPTLEQNLMKAMKGAVVTEVRSQQKEIVEKCVDATIKEVIAKPIGVPNNNSGVEE